MGEIKRTLLIFVNIVDVFKSIYEVRYRILNVNKPIGIENKNVTDSM